MPELRSAVSVKGGFVGVSAQGFDETQRKLKDLSADLQEKAVQAGLRFAAKPVRDKMRQLSPYRKGVLRKSISTRVANRRQKRRLGLALGETAVIVGPTKEGRVANILEGGAKPHLIYPKRTKHLRFLRVFANKIKHPGIEATQFMANALSLSGHLIESNFYYGMERYLDKRGFL